MKRRLATFLGIFILTAFIFGLINNKFQDGQSANCPTFQINDNSLPSNRKRRQINLNGIWQFSPANSSQPPPKTDWGEILVPGDWQQENNNSIPGITKRGTGKTWENFNGAKLSKAWYQRMINIPENWQNKAILLDFKRVSTDAEIYINGLKCGDIDWSYGAVDITKVVKPGKDSTLSVLVTAVADEKAKTIVMGPNEMYKTEANLDSRGLIGEIQLLSLPNTPRISDVFIQPSTRKKQIQLDVELSDVTEASTVKMLAQMLNQKGEIEQTFTANAKLEAKDKQILKLFWNWQNPQLWDIGKPNLYTLKLSVQGDKIDDEYNQQFGFREFWIEGRKFYLNGTEIRLRPIVAEEPWAIAIPQVGDRIIDGYNWAGFNIAELWPWNHDERGKWHFREDFAQRADLKGFPLIAPALDLAPIASNKAWNSSKTNWEQRMATDLRRYRNHPSILIWANSPNFFGHSDDQNPRRIGKKKTKGTINQIEDKRLQEIAPIAEEAISIIKKYDPTRPVMMHQGASVGDIYSLNSYLNMIPLQEREEWLSDWQKNGDMPYMVVEFGTPLHATMMRGRNGFAKAVVSEPLMTEFSAIYLGKQAYQLETSEYRNKIRELFVKDQEYKNWYDNPELNFAPAFQKLLSLFNTNTWRSWRTMGITGGMVPWHQGQGWQVSENGKKPVEINYSSEKKGVYLKEVPTSLWYKLQPQANTIHPSGQALLENNNSTLAWIAGTEITDKDHSFTAGEKLQKQVVLINDTRSTQPFSFNWQSTINQQITKQEKTGIITAGQTLFFPFEINLPKDTRQKIDGEINLQAKIGDRQHQDKFAFRIFPKLPTPTETITVFDPIGKTTKMLQQLGYKVVRWDKKNVPKLLIIGREALSSPLPELEAFVRNGGNVITFTQNPQVLQKLGFRISPHQTRRVFPVNSNHPILKGLDELDLRDWKGESTLTEAYPDTLNKTDVKRSPHGVPWYGWHWSNRGTISSANIEKPHNSSWRPILESEFDLSYSPLLELEYGKGRLILTTLDLEDHVSQDAAAAKIAQQIIEYGTTAPLLPKANKVVLIGNDIDQAKLDKLGLIYQRSNSLITDAELTIIGVGANMPEKDLQAYLTDGGKVFFLPHNYYFEALGVSLQQVKNFQDLPSLPNWTEGKGISISDLHSRTAHDAWLIKSGGEVASNGLLSRIKLGKGIAIFCQIDPDSLSADSTTYFRYTRWRQTRALSQLLANLGANFKADSAIFKSNSFNLYHPDYRTDFDLGDDPYRYYRW